MRATLLAVFLVGAATACGRFGYQPASGDLSDSGGADGELADSAAARDTGGADSGMADSAADGSAGSDTGGPSDSGTDSGVADSSVPDSPADTSAGSDTGGTVDSALDSGADSAAGGDAGSGCCVASDLFDPERANCTVSQGGPLAQAGNVFNTSGTANRVWGDGTYVYLADGPSGLHAFRFDGSDFTLLDTYSVSNAVDVWGDGSYVYLADRESDVVALSFNGNTFTLLDRISSSGPLSITGGGGYIFAANGGGVRSYSFDGFTLTQRGSAGHWVGQTLWFDGTYLLGGDRGPDPDALRTYTTTGGTLNSIDLVDMVHADSRDLFGDATYAYAAEDASGVVAYRMSGGRNTRLATYNTTGTAYGVWADGVYVYVADGARGVQVLSFNGITWTPHQALDLTQSSANGIWGDGTYVYAAEGADGIRAYSGFVCTDASP